MYKIFVYNRQYMESLPTQARPPAIKIHPGSAHPMQCLSGLESRFQAILVIDCFDRLERQQAERWLEINFRGQDYKSEEKSQQEQRQDAQLSFLK